MTKITQNQHTASINEMITRAKTVTGFSLKDLASIYGMSRHALYSSKEQASEISVQEWQRMQQVDDLIIELEAILTTSPGTLAKITRDEQGETLFSLLQQENLNTDQVKALTHQIAKEMDKRQHPTKQQQNTLNELTRHC